MPDRRLPLLASIDAAFESGPVVPCRPGCSACCRGPFDISPGDALALRAAIDQLEPGERNELIDRARAHLAVYASVLPGHDFGAGLDAIGEDAFDALCDALSALPCPALRTTGECAVYANRPITCRLMGRGWVMHPTEDTSLGEQLIENACPIQDRFPGYVDSPPTPIDLQRIEDALDEDDVTARDLGFVSTTVAGAIAHRLE